jgi:hypothetical protein
MPPELLPSYKFQYFFSNRNPSIDSRLMCLDYNPNFSKPSSCINPTHVASSSCINLAHVPSFNYVDPNVVASFTIVLIQRGKNQLLMML